MNTEFESCNFTHSKLHCKVNNWTQTYDFCHIFIFLPLICSEICTLRAAIWFVQGSLIRYNLLTKKIKDL